MHKPAVSIVVITTDTFPAWRELRLRALRDHPDAFGQPYAMYAAVSLEDALAQFEMRREAGTVIFGAFGEAGVLVGSIGVFRESGPRASHRLVVWGMYVTPEARSTGVGDALVTAALTEACTMDGILQVHLTVTSSNHAAVNLYARHGFVRWGTDPSAEMIDGVAFDHDHDHMVLIFDNYAISSHS